jgi:hypothetical protein
MIKLARTNKTVIVAAFMSIMSISLVSSSQAGALSLRDIVTGLTGTSQQSQTTTNTTSNQTANRGASQTAAQPTQTTTQNRNVVQTLLPTLTQQNPVVTPQPTQTAPTTQTPAPAQTQTTPAQTAQPATTTTSQATNNRTTTNQPTVAVKPVDTSAAVISTASQQSIGSTAADATPYVSNKLNPDLAKQLFYAGIVTITAGTLIYAATILPSRKQVRRIPVKSI